MTIASGANAPAGSGRSLLLRWLVAILAFPVGGFVGHFVGGPAAAVPAAAISGLIAGAVIGFGQALALGFRPHTVGLWTASTAIGLGVALALVTAVIGQIDTMADAVLLGVVSGLVLGAGQAAVLARAQVTNAWIWAGSTALAWGIGWSVTATIGVALAAGWPVYGLSGALVSQLITGAVAWKLLSRGEAAALAPA